MREEAEENNIGDVGEEGEEEANMRR